MLKRLILIAGLVSALVGSLYLGKMATQQRMLQPLDWVTFGSGTTD